MLWRVIQKFIGLETVKAKRVNHRVAIGCDLMEDRVVLSHSGLNGLLAGIKPGMIPPSMVSGLMSKMPQSEILKSLNDIFPIQPLSTVNGVRKEKV